MECQYTPLITDLLLPGSVVYWILYNTDNKCRLVIILSFHSSVSLSHHTHSSVHHRTMYILRTVLIFAKFVKLLYTVQNKRDQQPFKQRRWSSASRQSDPRTRPHSSEEQRTLCPRAAPPHRSTHSFRLNKRSPVSITKEVICDFLRASRGCKYEKQERT